MLDDALAIISEYAESPIADNRRNAATALAVVGTPESVQKLAALALEDSSDEVRQRSEQEIAHLEPATAQTAVAALLERLRDKQWAKGAYQLLGRLRNHGVRVPPRDERSFLARLRTAGASASLLKPNARWRPRLRPLLSGLVGGFAGAFLIGTVFTIDGEVSNPLDLGSLLGGGALLSMAIALFASQRTNPFNLHFDRTAGFVVELFWVGFGTAVLSALLAPIFVLIDVRVVSTVAFLIMLVGSMIAARFGTLLASGQFKSTVFARSISVLVGAGSGIAGLSLAACLVRWAFEMPYLPGVSEPMDIEQAIGSAWIVLLPASFGAAWGFSGVEARAPYSTKVATSSRRHVALTALAVYAGFGVSWLLGAEASAVNYVRALPWQPSVTIRGVDRKASLASVPDVASDSAPDSVRLETVPAAVQLKLAEPSNVNAVLNSRNVGRLVLLVYALAPQNEKDQAKGAGENDKLAELHRTALVRSNAEADYFFPPTLSNFVLEAGTYALVVDELDAWRQPRRPSVPTKDLLERTIDRSKSFVASLLSRGGEIDTRPVDPPYELTVQFEPETLRSRLDRLYGLGNLAEILNARLKERTSIADALQNANRTVLDPAQIEERDRKWQQDKATDPLVREINASACSQSLRDIQNTMPGLREIFLTGIQGVNVCQSGITTDYYQPDEPWWTDVLETEEVQFGQEEIDSSVKASTVSISMPITGPKPTDPEQQTIIGIAKAVFDFTYLYEHRQR